MRFPSTSGPTAPAGRTPRTDVAARTGIVFAGVAIAGLVLSGCSAGASAIDEASAGKVTVVASTNVYGDIASEIGGDLVYVTSLIDSAAQDPHSFEASAQDQLALSKAQLVIENGGGYDPFIDTLLDAGDSDAVVVNAAEASGLLEDDDHADDTTEDTPDDTSGNHTDGDGHDHIEGFNEHVWYSFHGVEHVAGEIASELGGIDPDNAAAYTANYDTFAAKIAVLEASAEALHPSTDGLGVAITEPVPLYLLEAVGLANQTPDAFSEAIEEGTDVAPLVLQRTLALFTGGSAAGPVAVLAYNGQTASPETEQVRAAAEDAGVPVVQFTETMPEGANYISWMTQNLDDLAAAVR